MKNGDHPLDMTFVTTYHNPVGKTRKTFGSLFAFVSVLSIISLGSVAPVSAGSSGCVMTSGAALAANCVYVNGNGRNVSRATSLYNSGIAPQNVCNIDAKFRYTPQYSSQTITYRFTSNCGVWRGWVDFNNPGNMQNKSSFCASQKNSVYTTYANYACVQIQLHIWD